MCVKSSRLADDMRDETKEKNQRIADKTFWAVSDPTETYVLPKPDEPVPYLNFAPLQNSLARLQESAQKFDAAMRTQSGKLTPQTQAALDQASDAELSVRWCAMRVCRGVHGLSTRFMRRGFIRATE